MIALAAFAAKAEEKADTPGQAAERVLAAFVSKDREALTAQQIEELQNAATQNSESVKALAAQVKTTFEGLESAAVDLQKRLDRQQKLSAGAAILGLSGLGVSLYVLLGG